MKRNFGRLGKQRATWHKHNGKNGESVVIFYPYGKDNPIELDKLDIEMIIEEGLWTGLIEKERLKDIIKIDEVDRKYFKGY